MELARPGTALITADTQRPVDHAIIARAVGRVSVKGLSDGIAAFELIAARSA